MESAEKKLRALPGYDEHTPATRYLRPQSFTTTPLLVSAGATDRFANHSHNIDRLISAAQSKIADLIDDQAPLAAVARDIRSFLTELVGLHTGTHQLDLGLEPFLDRLWEQGGYGELVRNLVRITDSCSSINDLVTCSELEQDFVEVVRWYQRRLTSLRSLELNPEAGQLADQIFGFAVIHDRVVSGLLGMEVSCSVRCVGRAGQPLWLKVFVAHDEGYVRPAAGWEGWADANEGSSVREIRFAAVASLSHPWQKFIADRINLFIPYEALDLMAGRLDLQLEAVLFDGRGTPLASAYCDELVSFLRSSNRSSGPKPMCIQPQALGVWATEFVYGSAIARFEVCRRFDSGVHLGGRAIEAWYDLDLIGQHQKPVTVEFCLQHADGSLVEDLRDNSPVIVRHIVHSISPVTRLRSQGIALSLRSVDVLDSEDLFAELSVLDDDGRLICGLVSPVTGTLIANQPKVSALSVVDRKSACTLRSLQVNPEELFNQHRFVQVVSTLNLPTRGVEPWQVVVKILDENGVLCGHGDVELIRSIWVAQLQSPPSAQDSEFNSRTITINFDQEEVLAKARLRGERKIKLQCQTRVFSSRGVLVSEGVCPFALAVPEDSTIVGAPAAHLGAPVWVEGLTFAASEPDRLSVLLSLNFLQSSPESELIKLYYELVDSHGQSLVKTEEQSDSSIKQILPGNISALHPNRSFACSAMPRRWVQMSVELDLDPNEILQSSTEVYLKLMLFSAHGHLEQVIRQPLPRSGLLSSALARIGDGALDRLEDVARDTTSSKKRRGFFAWH